MVIIGSGFYKILERLRKAIKEESIDSEFIPKEDQITKYICYFCNNKVEEGVWELKETGKIGRYETTSRFYIDSICYTRAKNFDYFYN